MAVLIAGVDWQAVRLIRECRRGAVCSGRGEGMFLGNFPGPIRPGGQLGSPEVTDPVMLIKPARGFTSVPEPVSTAERLYEHDNATRRTFDEAARHAEALFAAHDMSPARD